MCLCLSGRCNLCRDKIILFQVVVDMVVVEASDGSKKVKEYTCDVVVVGAGPAGSLAARFAAEGGLKVFVLEKRQEIGVPVRCGEGIAKVWLDEASIKPDPYWIVNEVSKARVVAPDGGSVLMDAELMGSECGYVVDRTLFDQTLASEAAREGVEFLLKTSATGLIYERRKAENGEERDIVAGVKARRMGEEIIIWSKIVVACDGFESMVARWAGIDTSLKPTDVNSCFEYHMVGIDVDRDVNEFHVGNEIAPGGYVWVFAKGEHEANVGIGVMLSRTMEKRMKGAARYYLDKFISSKPNLNKGQAIREFAGAVSLCKPLERTVADGLMVCGDAARMIDPLTGGGVVYACLSGKIAGQVCCEAVKANRFDREFLGKYEHGWRKLFENHLYRNYMAKELYIQLEDETFNKIIDSLKDVDMKNISTLEILLAVQQKYPELIARFEHLLQM
ncbi:MAG: NAD(P)/FAD-dependent oxidoreductase [Thermoplasmata archaeon]